MSSSSATSLMVRNASGALSTAAMLRSRGVENLLAAAGVNVVDALLEDRGRLEHHHPARRDRYFLAGLGIAPDPLALLAYHEGTEGRELHCFATFEAIGDLLEHQFDERCRFRARQPYLLVDRLAQVRACHRFCRHRQPRVRRSRYPSVFFNDIRLIGGGQREPEGNMGN